MDIQPKSVSPKLVWPTMVALLVVVIAGCGLYFLIFSRPAINTDVPPYTSNANQRSNINTTANLNPDTSIDAWMTYENDRYGYSFKYPIGSVIAEATKDSFSLTQDEIANGLSLQEIFENYSGKICITVKYRDIGYVKISAPENDLAAHVICGRTGVGVTKSSISRSLPIHVEGKEYSLKGHEFMYESPPSDNSESLNYHLETLVTTLEDKTRIEIGTISNNDFNFSDYLQIRNDLIDIIESYQRT